MPLETETYTLDEAIEELDDRIDDAQKTVEELDESSERAKTLTARRDRLRYLRDGLVWQRDNEEWGDAPIELGALTAGEKALMHREAPDTADREELRLWWVAAGTVDAPYVSGDLEETFLAVGATHPAFAEWAEAKINTLSTPGGVGNGSSTSSSETAPEKTSTDGTNSTT